ncbi:AimR family lysis-lysogeny pheromone receptor [Bacillus thuringiensis]
MKRIMKSILKKMEGKGYTRRSFAEKFGVSRETIRKGVNGQRELALDVFIEIVQELFESKKERREQIEKFIKKVSTDLNIRKSLAFCQGAGEHDLMDFLINKHFGKEKLDKFLGAYRLCSYRNKGEKKGEELLKLVNKKRYDKKDECPIIMEMLKVLCMYDERNFNAMWPHARVVEEELTNLKKIPYIKKYLDLHHKERLAYIRLLSNKLEEAREIADEILSSPLDIPIAKSTALCCKGESYIFSDVLQAESYILSALSLLEEANVSKNSYKYKAYKTTLAFIYIEFGFNLDKIDFDNLKEEELAYYEGKFGCEKKAQELFKALEKKGMSAFAMYYQAVLKSDIIGLQKALEEFEKNGNILYSTLAKRALLKEKVS